MYTHIYTTLLGWRTTPTRVLMGSTMPGEFVFYIIPLTNVYTSRFVRVILAQGPC